MGRPPLKLLRTHIAFDPETLRRLDRIVGPKGRAAFIRKAVDQALDTIELAQKLKAEKAGKGE